MLSQFVIISATRHRITRAVSSAQATWINLRHSSLSLVLTLPLIACGPMTKIAGMSDAELRAEMAECHNIANPSNSKAISCQNFKRECEKRVRDDGRYREC